MGSYNTVKNTTVWAFTRGVVGPMDVTPRIYNGSITTGHSTAMNILFQSGMPCMASSVEDYRSSPAISLLKNLPAQWDDIHFIDGYPGKFTTLARRTGDNWYAASITSNEARNAVFPLDFLTPGVNYVAVIYRDGAGSRDMIVEAKAVTSEDTLTIPMSVNGSCAVKLLAQVEGQRVERILLPDEITLEAGGTTELIASVLPETVQNSSVTWTVADSSVASIVGNALTSLDAGVTTVTATSDVNPLVPATTILRVTGRKFVPAGSWSISNPAAASAEQTEIYPNEPNKITLKTLTGDLNHKGGAQNVWLYDAPEGDFELTVKVTHDAFTSTIRRSA